MHLPEPTPAMPERKDLASDRLRRASDIAWRSAVLVGVAAVIAAVLWRLRVVTLPVFVAVLICTALAPPVVALERRGWRPALAAWAVLGSFLVVAALVLVLIVPPTAEELGGLDAAVTEGLQEVEDWLVDGPLGLERDQVSEWTDEPLQRAIDLAESTPASISSGIRTAGEVLIGAVLSLVLTFFFLKDGRRFQDAARSRLPARHVGVVSAVGATAWSSFSGFLRGAAMLGVVEGLVIGVTMWLVGAPLALPVAVLTFAGAFFPIVGAIVAGTVAVLVALASGGLTPALIVGIVAVVVQQLDNDLLAPFVYGRTLELHPAVILLALTAGASLGGIAGAFVAVPLTSAVMGALREIWRHRAAIDPPVVVERPGPETPPGST